MRLYHFSDARNRESIRWRGLIPHRPGRDGNWRCMWLVPVYGWGVVRQPRAIYVWPEDPRPKRPTDTRDVWMFDYEGPIEPDRYCQGIGSLLIRERIPPARLQLLAAAA